MSTSLKRMVARVLRALEILGFRSRVVDHRRMQTILVVEMMVEVSCLLLTMVFSAGRPTVAVGIVFQAVAGLLSAPRLWANSAADSAIKWAACQIEKNRFGIIGLFDGSPRSFVITLGWCSGGAFCAGAAPIPADGILDWMFVAFALIITWSGVLAFMFATMAVSARTFLVGIGSPPDGIVLRTFGDWLTARDWVWPMAGLLILIGCLLQLTAT